MISIHASREDKVVEVELTESEMRYLVGASLGLLTFVPSDVMETYVNFSKDEILEFSSKIRKIMDEHDMSM